MQALAFMIWNPSFCLLSTIFCASCGLGTYWYQWLKSYRKKDPCVWCSHGEFIIVCLAAEMRMYYCLSELFMPPTHKYVVFCFWPEWTPYLSMNFSWCWLCFTPLLWATPTPCSSSEVSIPAEEWMLYQHHLCQHHSFRALQPPIFHLPSPHSPQSLELSSAQ